MHGWLIIDKPVGIGSTQVVGKVKRALREGGYAKVKVGHGGTLDPLASGVLPIALGEATKLAGRMLDSDKVYEFTIAFGEETDTLDAEGKVIARSDHIPDYGDIEDIMYVHFLGEIDQVPPAYSALKIDGERAYDLARSGEAVTLPSRRVTIHDIEYLAESEELDGTRWAKMRAHVSKGTYIRSLARDMAYALGTVGHVTYLRRTKAGPFTLAHAISLDNLAALAMARRLEEEALLPLAAGLDDIPALTVTPQEADMLRKGQQPSGSAARPGLHLAVLDAVPVALVESIDGGILRVVRGFNLQD